MVSRISFFLTCIALVCPWYLSSMQNEYEGLEELFTEYEDWDKDIEALPDGEKKQKFKETVQRLKALSNGTISEQRNVLLREFIITFLKSHKECSRDSLRHSIRVAKTNSGKIYAFSCSLQHVQKLSDHTTDTNRNVEQIRALQDISNDELIEVSNGK